MDRDESDRWEYETLRPPRGETMKESEDPTAEMNELAAEGWRLAETIDYTGGGTKYIVFERPAGSGIDDASGCDDADTDDSGGSDDAETDDGESAGTETGDDTDDTNGGHSS